MDPRRRAELGALEELSAISKEARRERLLSFLPRPPQREQAILKETEPDIPSDAVLEMYAELDEQQRE